MTPLLTRTPCPTPYQLYLQNISRIPLLCSPSAAAPLTQASLMSLLDSSPRYTLCPQPSYLWFSLSFWNVLLISFRSFLRHHPWEAFPDHLSTCGAYSHLTGPVLLADFPLFKGLTTSRLLHIPSSLLLVVSFLHSLVARTIVHSVHLS